jgi:hypothetical protein
VKPVFQETGDNQCLRCCIATIFEMPLDEVPFFGGALAFDQEAREGAAYGLLQRRELTAWLRKLGLAHTDITAKEDGTPAREWPWGICIANGPTERGTYHAVVWDAEGHHTDTGWPRWVPERREFSFGRMVHDPHPSGAGLLRVESWTCFVVRDPAALARGVRLEG